MELSHGAIPWSYPMEQVKDGGGGNEAEDEMKGNSRLGRAVLSARVLPETKLDVNKKSVQCNLHSQDTSGKPMFARYNIPLESPDKAEEFVRIVRSCVPS